MPAGIKNSEYTVQATVVVSGDLFDLTKKISSSPDLYESQKLDFDDLQDMINAPVISLLNNKVTKGGDSGADLFIGTNTNHGVAFKVNGTTRATMFTSGVFRIGNKFDYNWNTERLMLGANGGSARLFVSADSTITNCIEASGNNSTSYGLKADQHLIGVEITDVVSGGAAMVVRLSGADKFSVGRNGEVKVNSFAGGGTRMAVFDNLGNLGVQAIPSGGSGTVTSVGLTMPSGFNVTNSPVTTSGTLTVTTTLNGFIKGNGTGFTAVSTIADTDLTEYYILANGDRMLTDDWDAGPFYAKFGDVTVGGPITGIDVFNYDYGVSVQSSIICMTLSGTGDGLVSDTDGTALYATSRTVAGLFSQNGILAANNTDPVVNIFREFELEGFDATAPLVDISDSTAATGPQIRVTKQGNRYFLLDHNGEVTIDDLAGAGTRVVTASSTGLLSTTSLQATKLFQSTTSTSNTSTSEVDLFTYTVPGGTLSVNGQEIDALFVGYVDRQHGADTRRFKIYFAGTAIFDSGALVYPNDGNWQVKVRIIRESSTVIRASITLLSDEVAVNVLYTSLSGLTLSSDNILKITGTSSGAGAVANDITGHMASIQFIPAA